MKKYKEYMDSVTVSDTLHEKLRNLETPKKKPQPWKKYAAAAAALVLVAGLGIWGLSRLDGTEAGRGTADCPESSDPARSEVAIGEIATDPARSELAIDEIPTEPFPMPDSPGMEMMWGYEVDYGETVAYYMLPVIGYGQVENEMAADIALPVGVTRRDLTEKELLALFGGEDNLTTHLNWGGYELSAHAMVWPDGSLWVLYIHGSKGDTGYEHFTLEAAPGMMPPSCIVYPESVTNDVWGVEVKADGHDGEHASSRRVSFMDGGYGYRFEITGTDTDAITELVSRVVRYIIVGDGLLLNQNLDVPADAPDPSSTDYSVGEPNFEDAPSTEPAEPTQEVSTPAHDPSAS